MQDARIAKRDDVLDHFLARRCASAEALALLLEEAVVVAAAAAALDAMALCASLKLSLAEAEVPRG